MQSQGKHVWPVPPPLPLPLQTMTLAPINKETYVFVVLAQKILPRMCNNPHLLPARHESFLQSMTIFVHIKMNCTIHMNGFVSTHNRVINVV